MGFMILIILTQGFTSFLPWSASDFFIAYISVILFVVLYVGHKIIKKTRFVDPAMVDLDTGRKEVDDMVFQEVVPSTLMGRFWHWLG